MKIKEFLLNKAVGFYVGVASMVLALITMIIYIAMGSMYFSPWIIVCLIGGIACYVVSTLIKIQPIAIASYMLYCVAFSIYLVYEIEYRMDTIIAEGIGGLDAIFIVAIIFFIISILSGIVATCLKQEKEVKA